MRAKIFALLICLLLVVISLTAMPSAMAQTEEHGSVYNYEIISVTQTGTDEITIKVQARYCPYCNPNGVSNPGCTAFACGYPPPYYPYSAGCYAGYPDGRFVAVRIKDGTGTILGTQKLVCNPTNWPINSIIARDFVFTGVPLAAGSTVIAEADVYCSWCGHWYPSPKSLEVAPLRVCIDPGHGGAKLGTLGWDDMIPDGEGCDWKYDSEPTFPNEADINLNIALKLKALLEANNIAVYMTRTTDTDVSLQERCDIANNNDCDVFVSIHCNAQGCGVHDPEHPVPDANGTETHYYPGSIDGLDLAKRVQSELVESAGLSDRGTKATALYVLANTEMPASLVEVAYLTNPADFGFLTNQVYVPPEINVLMPDNSVVSMGLDEYLRGVVCAEMGPDWVMETFGLTGQQTLEALKAQAAAARCFVAARHLGIMWNPHSGTGADVCTETCCQKWSPETHPLSDEAVATTHNVVITHEGAIIQAFFFSHCDGHTRNNEEVWPGSPIPYLRSVPCICGKTELNGHGVGMCQHGAIAMAKDSYEYEDILRHYYSGAKVGSFVIDETSTEKAAQGIENGIIEYFEGKGLTITGYSPIGIVVTDPDGLRISKEVNEIPGATYNEVDLDGDGDLDDQVRIPDRKIGEYIVAVVPEPDALPTDTYTVEVSLFGTPVIVAENVQIADIPSEPYVIESTPTGIVLPIIEAAVRIEPETMNLRSNGVFTAFITLPEDYAVKDIDVGTVICNGAPAIRGMVSEKDSGTLIAKFNREDLVNVTPGGEVALTVTGQLADGTRFEGNDILRVIDD